MSAPESIPYKVWLVLGAIALFLSLYCLVRIHTRHRGVSLAYRLLWSCVVLLPLLGPLLYGALFSRIAPETLGGGADYEWENLTFRTGRRLGNPWDGGAGDMGGEGGGGGDGGGGD
jgi:hypothetical protein